MENVRLLELRKQTIVRRYGEQECATPENIDKLRKLLDVNFNHENS